jgi:cystathionine beta-lyase
MTPIYQTTTYAQERPGVHKGFEYSRSQNPTRQTLENNLAALENGKFGLAFSSGLAAIDAAIKLLSPGDEVISTNDLYGGTYRLFNGIWERYGIKFHFVGLDDLERLDELVNENTKMVWIETPTNPTLKIVDIERVCSWAKAYKLISVVDNTFATPYLQNPLDLGADIVMHSATKYLGGHSDVMMGALVTRNEQIADQLYFFQNSCGAVPGPQDCFLALRGIKTLHLRMERHSENAAAIAAFLEARPEVKDVYWPGLKTHPNHEVAQRQMRNFGGMVSFSLQGDSVEKAFDLVSATKVFTLAESLGGVESLIGHPATMTHASIPREERQKSGVVDSLIRLSVGVEHVDDLVNDLDHAFNSMKK